MPWPAAPASPAGRPGPLAGRTDRAAGPATAGVVAYNLPAPANTAAGSGTTTTPAAQPSAANQEPGDDGGSEDSGGEDGGAITAPGGTFGQGPAQAVSGGS